MGVAVPPEVRRALEVHLRGIGEHPLPGRAVPSENWHLTLRFLGDTPAERKDALRRALRAAPLGGAFPLRFGGCGAFPRPARAAVLWLGLGAGGEPLHRLAAAVETVAQAAGFEPEPRAFHPHLTLSRLQPPQDVRALVAGFPPFDTGFEVREAVLFRSRLGRGPAKYEALDSFPLDPQAI